MKGTVRMRSIDANLRTGGSKEGLDHPTESSSDRAIFFQKVVVRRRRALTGLQADRRILGPTLDGGR